MLLSTSRADRSQFADVEMLRLALACLAFPHSILYNETNLPEAVSGGMLNRFFKGH
jgi:hypothetical protein